MRDLPGAETSTLQHTILLRERHPGPRSPFFVNKLCVKMVSRRASWCGILRCKHQSEEELRWVEVL